MNTLALSLLIGLLNLAALAVLMKHRRNVRHHRSSTPLIGRHPQLTEVLHARLCDRQPHNDWLNPCTMQRKVAAWTQANTTHHTES